MTTAKRWRRSLANGYRNWRYGTRDRPTTRLGVPLAYLMPTARAMIDSDFRHLPPGRRGRRVLDVGFGNGSFLRWAAAAGWEAVGVDPDPVAVAAARNAGLNAYHGTVEVLQDQLSSFDVVTLSHVIEHVHDPRGLLQSICELLKPGGMLWLDTPNISSFGHRLFGPTWIGLDPPRHLIIFNIRTLRDLLESAGFRIVRHVSRFEVGRVTYPVSEGIRGGSRHPLTEWRCPLGLKVQAYRASWRVRWDPRQSEFITFLAAKM